MINIKTATGMLTALMLLAFQPVVHAAHTNAHVKTLANQEITKRAPFAHVLANGTVDLARSSGVIQAHVTSPAIGLYCFSGPAGIKGAQVTIDYLETVNDETAQFGFGDAVCGAGTLFFVYVTDHPGYFNSVDGGFFIRLYK